MPAPGIAGFLISAGKDDRRIGFAMAVARHVAEGGEPLGAGMGVAKPCVHCPF